MKKLFRILTFVSILAFFGACGEGFRGASSSNSSQPNESEYFNDEGTRRSFTESNVDRDILLTYADDLEGEESETRALTSIIEAFDLKLTADSNENFAMEATVVIGCNESYFIERTVDRSVLQSGQTVNLGSDGPFEVEIRCTSSSCQELVAAVHKTSGSNQGTVLVGLAVGGNNEDMILYVSRDVEFTPYFATFDHVQRFEQVNSCSIDEANGGSGDIWETLTDNAVEIGVDLLGDWLEQNGSDLLDDLF